MLILLDNEMLYHEENESFVNNYDNENHMLDYFLIEEILLKD